MTMPYSGHVAPDGPWQDRRDGPVHVRKLSVGSMDNNVYVISCARTGVALLVDAADRPQRLREAIADTEPLAVVQTHGHFDHVRAWQALQEDPGLEVWGHDGDAALFPCPVDRGLVHEQRLAVGDLEVTVLHTPGHTDGSLQYLVAGDERDHLFSGDSLFPGGPGRTTTPAAFAQIMGSLHTQIFDRLDDTTWVYPGHGDDTTIGAERPSLPAWRERGW